MELKLIGIYQLLVYADDSILQVDNVVTVKKHKTLTTDAGKDVDLEIKVERTQYTSMLLSCQQNLGLNHNIETAKISFENVAHYKYLGTTLKSQ
jgi:hypothetical protein